MPEDQNPQGSESNQGNGDPVIASATVTGQPKAQPTAPVIPEGYVPAENLRAVTAERDRLAKQQRERDEKEAQQRGEWEGIAKTREQERDAAIERAKGTAIRAAFVSAVGPSVVDATAAFVLARDAGLLKDVKVSDDFEADEKAVQKAVEEALKRFTYLKAGSKSFGDPRDGSIVDPPIDPSKASARDLLRHGYDSAGSTRRQGG